MQLTCIPRIGVCKEKVFSFAPCVHDLPKYIMYNAEDEDENKRSLVIFLFRRGNVAYT